jgi:hypothetical protein
MINNMDMDFKFGLMEADIKAITILVKKVVKENIYGKMEVIMKVIGMIIKLQEKENMFGQTVENIKGSG